MDDFKKLFQKIDWADMPLDDFGIFFVFALAIKCPEMFINAFDEVTLTPKVKKEFSKVMLQKGKEYGIELPTQLHILFTQNL